MSSIVQPVYRFAPSPNGWLHLGHAYSALVNFELAHMNRGRFLLRIEDIDQTRCLPALEADMQEDLAWLSITWDAPPRRQSEHFGDYADALDILADAGLVYPATLSRGAVKRMIAEAARDGIEWPRDPDGAPHYPTAERARPAAEQDAITTGDAPFAWRLNMDAALAHIGTSLSWVELGADGEQVTRADPAVWGDVVLARKDAPTSYHLAVVVDDALQGVSHVVRGRDLYAATGVHRLLQELLGLPAPVYTHHDLILNEDGDKLSKSNHDTSLRSLRAAGLSPADIRRMVGL